MQPSRHVPRGFGRQQECLLRHFMAISWPLALLAGAMALTCSASAPGLAQTTTNPSLQGAELLTALRAGGYILYFRHADTDHTQRDSRGMDLNDCAAQRNLSQRGRDNARAIGEALRALGIPIMTVLASPLC